MPKIFEHYGSSIKSEFHKLYSLIVQDKGDELVAQLTPETIHTVVGLSTWENMDLLHVAINGAKLATVKKLLAADGVDLNKVITFNGNNTLGCAIYYYRAYPGEKNIYKQIIVELIKKDPSCCKHYSVATQLKQVAKDDPIAKLIEKLRAYEQCDEADHAKKSELAKEAGVLFKELGDEEQHQEWLTISRKHQNIWETLQPLLKQKKYAEAKAAFEKEYAATNEAEKAVVIDELLYIVEKRNGINQFNSFLEFRDNARFAAELVQSKAPDKMTQFMKWFQPLSASSISKEVMLYVENKKTSEEIEEDRANLCSGLQMVYGTLKGEPKNLAKAITQFRKVKKAEFLPQANLFQYIALCNLFQESDAERQVEIFADIAKLHVSIMSYYIGYFQEIDKKILLQEVMLPAIKKAHDRKHKIQLYEFMIALVSQDNNLSVDIVKNLLDETRKILNPDKETTYAPVFKHLGDFHVRNHHENSTDKALKAYRQAVHLGDMSAAIPAAEIASSTDEIIDLYTKALAYYTDVNTHDRTKAREVVSKLEAMKSSYLLQDQKEKVAQIASTTPGYAGMVAENARQQSIASKVQILEELSQKESLDEASTVQLAFLVDGAKLPAITHAVNELQTYFSQKAKQKQQQELFAKDVAQQVKNKELFTTGNSGMWESANQDYLPSVMSMMRHYFTRVDLGIGSVRRKLYLCTKTLLLSTPIEMAKKRFPDISDATLQLRIRDATDYLTRKSKEAGFKYKNFARWCLQVVEQQKAQKILLLNPDALLLQQAKYDGYQADVSHGIREVLRSVHSSSTLRDTADDIIAKKLKEDICVQHVEESLADVKQIITTLKTQVAQAQAVKPVVNVRPALSQPAAVSVSSIPVQEALVQPAFVSASSSASVPIVFAQQIDANTSHFPVAYAQPVYASDSSAMFPYVQPLYGNASHHPVQSAYPVIYVSPSATNPHLAAVQARINMLTSHSVVTDESEQMPYLSLGRQQPALQVVAPVLSDAVAASAPPLLVPDVMPVEQPKVSTPPSVAPVSSSSSHVLTRLANAQPVMPLLAPSVLVVENQQSSDAASAHAITPPVMPVASAAVSSTSPRQFKPAVVDKRKKTKKEEKKRALVLT